MGRSKIPWLVDNPYGAVPRVWDPQYGCAQCSPGCDNCWALKEAWMRANNPTVKHRWEGLAVKTDKGLHWSGEVRFFPDRLDEPRTWKEPSFVFAVSRSDLFYGEGWLGRARKVLDVIVECPQHRFLILTKRAKQMHAFFQAHDKYSYLRNLCVGVTVTDQSEVRGKVPFLLEAPVCRRFLSIEPALGRMSLGWVGPCVDWIIVGGETGADARKMEPTWVVSMLSGGVKKMYFKSWGKHVPSYCSRDRICGNLDLSVKNYPKWEL